jgi:two-component system KDP operon response regulator KdpE
VTDAMYQVLVVDDDASIRTVLRALLEAEGYRVAEAGTAERALVEARTHKPDILLVDLGLPGADGMAVIRGVRQWSPVPVIVISARSMEEQKVAALDAGADDYVTKPFAAAELLARLRAALRRNVQDGRHLPLLHFPRVTVDLTARRARDAAGGDVHLTPLEFRVLECLARNAGLVVTSRQLLREAWGPDRVEDSGRLRVCMKALRDKLEENPRVPRCVVTETGLGYRMASEVLEPPAGMEGPQPPR